MPMTRARFVIAVLALALASGCQKHGQSPMVGGTMPGTGATTAHTYTGAVVLVSGCGSSCYQDVPVNADVITYSGDVVNAYLCKGQDCVNGPLPAQSCASTGFVAPCYTTTPSPSIVFGHDIIRFVNAAQAGYSTYIIQTEVMR